MTKLEPTPEQVEAIADYLETRPRGLDAAAARALFALIAPMVLEAAAQRIHELLSTFPPVEVRSAELHACADTIDDTVGRIRAMKGTP